jgi:hypothetical protein
MVRIGDWLAGFLPILIRATISLVAATGKKKKIQLVYMYNLR